MPMPPENFIFSRCSSHATRCQYHCCWPKTASWKFEACWFLACTACRKRTTFSTFRSNTESLLLGSKEELKGTHSTTGSNWIYQSLSPSFSRSLQRGWRNMKKLRWEVSLKKTTWRWPQILLFRWIFNKKVTHNVKKNWDSSSWISSDHLAHPIQLGSWEDEFSKLPLVEYVIVSLDRNMKWYGGIEYVSLVG